MVGRIVFPELEMSRSHDGCTGCFGEKYHKPSTDCLLSRFVEDVYGINCDTSDFIFIKPEVWRTCTRSNTKVGDEIRCKIYKHANIVEYFFKKANPTHDVVLIADVSFPSILASYEINVNR